MEGNICCGSCRECQLPQAKNIVTMTACAVDQIHTRIQMLEKRIETINNGERNDRDIMLAETKGGDYEYSDEGIDDEDADED